MSMPTDSGMKMRPRSTAGVAMAANCADGRHSTMTSRGLGECGEIHERRRRPEAFRRAPRLGLVARGGGGEPEAG